MPPHFMVMLLGPVAPYREISSDRRSVGEPAPRTRTTGPSYRSCKARDQYAQDKELAEQVQNAKFIYGVANTSADGTVTSMLDDEVK